MQKRNYTNSMNFWTILCYLHERRIQTFRENNKNKRSHRALYTRTHTIGTRVKSIKLPNKTPESII